VHSHSAGSLEVSKFLRFDPTLDQKTRMMGWIANHEFFVVLHNLYDIAEASSFSDMS
jgi:hypothetical protein